MKISVVMPSYNQAKFLPETLASVRAQTHKAVEHFVLDPGSDDGSRDIANMAEGVTLIAEPDNGQADAINKGFRLVNGDIIAWLNSDDCYYDEAVFSKVVEHFEQDQDLGILYGKGIYVDDNDQYLREAHVIDDVNILGSSLQTQVGILQPALFMRADVPRRIGLLNEDLHFCMDYEFWIRAFQSGVKFKYVPEYFAKAKYYPDNKTFGDRGRSFEEVCGMLKGKFGYVAVNWLVRYAEYLVEGWDGMLINEGVREHVNRPAVEVKVNELMKRYNGDHVAFEVLKENKGRAPYSKTWNRLVQLAVELPPRPVRIDNSVKNLPGRTLYTVGPQRWSFHRGWKESATSRSINHFRKLKETRNRKICVLVGNGPSLNNTDLSLLEGNDVFISNYAFLNKDLAKHAKFLAVTNYLVAEQGSHQFNGLAGLDKLYPYWLSYCVGGEGSYFFDSIGYAEFSTDIENNVSWRSTVSFFLLQIVYWLGYEKVIMIGFDHSYQQDDNLKEGDLIEQNDNDENHFDATYFKGKKWQAADVGNMEDMYRLANEAFKADGREVVNCTAGGKLGVFRRGELENELKLGGCHPEQLAIENSFPKVLVFSTSATGSECATGQLSKLLFNDWPESRFMHVYVAPGAVNGKKSLFKYTGKTDSTLAACLNFSPDVIYYRPADKPVDYHQFVTEVIEAIGAPYIVHMMDDWPARLKSKEPKVYGQLVPPLERLIGSAVVNLSICEAMSKEYQQRYGREFMAFANAVFPSEWQDDGKESTDSKRDFVIRYCGALADDMTRQGVTDLAKIVGTMDCGRKVRFEIYTMDWCFAAAEKLARNKCVSAHHLVAPDEYHSLLKSSDALLVTYNFDKDTEEYIRFSMANKLPEYMASGVPILAYGPRTIATMDFIAERDFAKMVDERDLKKLKQALHEIVTDNVERKALVAKAQNVVFSEKNATKMIAEFKGVVEMVAGKYGWKPGTQVNKADDGGLVGIYDRDSCAHIDETDVVADLVAAKGTGVMIDVGAHQGSSAAPFLKHGWRVHAFEPDPNNRAKLEKRYKSDPNISIDTRAVSNKSNEEVSFYASDESTGISGLSAFRDTHKEICRVTTTTLTDYCEVNKIDHVDFLKIDTEGFDLFVLQGFDWQRFSPDIVECEFEDNKTVALGYTFHDIAQYLVDKGYVVYVSEWHPIVRYGIRHNWKRLVKYPCHLAGKDAWGNLVAFKEQPSEEHVAAVLGSALAKTVKKVQPSDKTMTATEGSASGKESSNDAEGILGIRRRLLNATSRYLGFYRNKRGMFTLASVLMIAFLQLDGVAGFITNALPFVAPGIVDVLLTFISAGIVLLLIALLYGRLQHEAIAYSDHKSRYVDNLRKKAINALKKPIARIAAIENNANREIHGLKTGVNQLRGNTSKLAVDVNTLSTDVNDFKINTKQEVKDLFFQLASTLSDIERVKFDNEADRISQKNISDQIKLLGEKISDIFGVPIAELNEGSIRSGRFLENNAGFNPPAHQYFSRRLSQEQRTHFINYWCGKLGLEYSHEALAYISHKICEIEASSHGRLATSLQSQLLRVLVAKSIDAKELKILEIGTLFGVNIAILYDLCRYDNDVFTVTTLDPLDGYYKSGAIDKFTGMPVTEKVTNRNFEKVGLESSQVQQILRLSTDEEALKEASKQTYNLLIIDGDHTYEGVKFDFEVYQHLVEKGGMIIFDDYETTEWPDIKRYVDESVMGLSHLEFIGAEWGTCIFKVIGKAD
ncbi:FkbM family methyltransferase [Oceanicoccus sp. KOV_DT_Chl]|uniref:FkbM family methyltransferase n=1 Tax=Oceanicoccus sp. KOV_DT_Chl TaxID=1904639 RepID=UPI0013570BD7|nr:FkbM family methyltransferase [Oceanicoccus sp. KOV_DT_Chl]